MINKIPIVGWGLAIIAAVGLAVPFWFCWTLCGVGEEFFYFIPGVYQKISFWNCIGLFIVIAIIKGTLVPRLFSVSNSQSNSQKVGEG